MRPDTLRLIVFLGGLFTLLSWELAAPHHSPTVSRFHRWRVNLSLAALNGAVVSGLCALCYTIAAGEAAPWRFGLFQLLALPVWARISLEVLTLDLLVYLFHRAYHRVPAFWRFHHVHHTDLDLDVTSASRFHLGEVLISAVGKLAAVVALGISPIGLVSFEVVMLLAAQFQHGNLRVPPSIERVLWWTFVPPAMHRIHHRPDPADTDSNFGTVVTWWDRLFGTYRPRAAVADAFGLELYRDERRLGLLAVLGLPFDVGQRTSSRQAGTH